jgi:hypothetical protein
MHRVRAPSSKTSAHNDGFGRFSIPFFFEPGEECIVRTVSVDVEGGVGEGEGVRYGDHVRSKMGRFIRSSCTSFPLRLVHSQAVCED